MAVKCGLESVGLHVRQVPGTAETAETEREEGRLESCGEIRLYTHTLTPRPNRHRHVYLSWISAASGKPQCYSAFSLLSPPNAKEKLQQSYLKTPQVSANRYCSTRFVFLFVFLCKMDEAISLGLVASSRTRLERAQS